jgi:hypothetical protein
MSVQHEHTHRSHVSHATADVPTLSVLRLAAVQRLAGTAIVLAALWAAVIAVIGQVSSR